MILKIVTFYKSETINGVLDIGHKKERQIASSLLFVFPFRSLNQGIIFRFEKSLIQKQSIHLLIFHIDFKQSLAIEAYLAPSWH